MCVGVCVVHQKKVILKCSLSLISFLLEKFINELEYNAKSSLLWQYDIETLN